MGPSDVSSYVLRDTVGNAQLGSGLVLLTERHTFDLLYFDGTYVFVKGLRQCQCHLANSEPNDLKWNVPLLLLYAERSGNRPCLCHGASKIGRYVPQVDPPPPSQFAEKRSSFQNKTII